jgi:hypothetical protein
MSDSPKVVSLTRLRDPIAGLVEINDERYEVRKYSGFEYQRAALLGEATPVTELYDLVRKVAPTMPEDVVLSLDRDLCLVVLGVASQGIAVVERLLPNAVSPEAPTSPG